MEFEGSDAILPQHSPEAPRMYFRNEVKLSIYFVDSIEACITSQSVSCCWLEILETFVEKQRIVFHNFQK